MGRGGRGRPRARAHHPAAAAVVAGSGVAGPALGVRGVPAADRPRAARAAGPDRGRRARRRSSTKRRGGSRARSGIWRRPAARPGGAVCRGAYETARARDVRGTLGELATAADDGGSRPAANSCWSSGGPGGAGSRPAAEGAAAARLDEARAAVGAPRGRGHSLVARDGARHGPFRRRNRHRAAGPVWRGPARLGHRAIMNADPPATPSSGSSSAGGRPPVRRSARIVVFVDAPGWPRLAVLLDAVIHAEKTVGLPSLPRSPSSAWPGSSACRPSGSVR